MSEYKGWKRFKKVPFDSKRLSQRALKAEILTKRHARKFVTHRLRALRDVRQYIVSWLFIIIALIATVALQMTWYQQGYKTAAAVEGGTYAEATVGPIDTLNPLFASSGAEQSASRLLFSRLYDYDATGHLRNDVATSITTDPSQTIYTLVLRNDALWHDGKNLTADDVVYTVEMMKNPEVRSVMRNNWREINVKKLSDTSVQFILPAPYATFQHALTFAIVPRHILSQVRPSSIRESTFSVSPIGSGPFKLRLLQTAQSAKNGQKIAHMNKWEKYYRGVPKLERFELHAYDKAESLVHALETNDVNAAAGLSVTDEVSANFVVKDIPVGGGVYTIFNTKSPQLADVSVRQALQRGTDVALLRKKIGNPNYPLDLPFIPSQVSAGGLPIKPPLNIVEANNQLETAGWKLANGKRSKEGKILQLKIALIKDEKYKAIADELTLQWRGLGIEVEEVVFDPEKTQRSFAQEVLQARTYDVLINELVIGGDADVYAYWHSSQAQAMGYNFSNYSNGISDDTLASARARLDDDLRGRKYAAFAAQWLKDAPAIGLFQSSVRYAHSKSVTATEKDSILPTAIDRYSNVLYWTAERGQVYRTP